VSCIFSPIAEIPLPAIDADQILNFKYVQQSTDQRSCMEILANTL